MDMTLKFCCAVRFKAKKPGSCRTAIRDRPTEYRPTEYRLTHHGKHEHERRGREEKMTYYNDCNNVPGSEGGRTDERTAVGRPYAPVGHVPPISRQGRPPDPQCTYSSSRSSPSPITIMPRVALGPMFKSTWSVTTTTRTGSEMVERLRKVFQETGPSGRHSPFDPGGRLAPPPPSDSLSLTPPLSQKSSSRESDRGRTDDREKPGRVCSADAEAETAAEGEG